MTPSMIFDISVTLGVESIPFPGDPDFSREMLVTIEQSGVCGVSKIEMSAHSGTHIDMPSHFIKNGKTLDDYSADRFVLPARVLAVSDTESVKASHIEAMDIPPGSAILFKTENSTTGRITSGRYDENYVYISPEAAAVCADKKAGLVGLDYITVEKHGDETNRTHKTLLGSGVLILEAINLHAVPPGDYTLICLPLKIKSGEASPVRAVLMPPQQ